MPQPSLNRKAFATRALDVGCGNKKVKGAIGIDMVKTDVTDVVHDLTSLPWPFDDDAFDVVYVNHVLEHFLDVIPIMKELHRVTNKKVGEIKIRVPHFSSWNYYADLTHKTPFSFRSFDHFTDDDPSGYNFYTPVKFRIYRRELRFVGPNARLNPWKILGVEWFANKFPRIYERLAAFILPCAEIFFVLRPSESNSRGST